VIGIGGTDQVQQTGYDQELGAVVCSGVGDGAMSPVQGASDDIEPTRSQIADKAEDVKDIAAVKQIDVALRCQADQEHGDNGGHEQQAANPAPLDEVAGAGDQPSQSGRDHRHFRDLDFGGFNRGLCSDGIGHSDEYDLSLNFTCYFSGVGPNQLVYFAAHPKLGQINSRLDGKTRIGQDAALVVNFQIIHVGAVSVDFGGDGVAGAVNEVISEPGVLDVRTNRAVNLPTGNGAILLDGFLNGLHTHVAGVAHGRKDLFHAVRRRFTDKASPGDVVVDRAGSVFLTPDIEQNEIAFADGL